MITSADIRAWRQRLGVSQEEAAALLWVSARSVSRWETGQTRPRGRVLRRLEKMMGREAPAATMKETPCHGEGTREREGAGTGLPHTSAPQKGGARGDELSSTGIVP